MTFAVEDFLSTTTDMGARYARMNPGIGLDAEDISQELNLHLLVRREEFESAWDGWDKPEAVVKTFLDRKASTYCKTRRTEALRNSAQYAYTPEGVRTLLETFFDVEAWYGARVPEDARSLSGHDGVEMSSDIARVWDRLSKPQARSLFKRYALGWQPGAGSAERRAVYRAVDALTDHLNAYSVEYDCDGPGSRAVVSNAMAEAMTKADWSSR